MWFQSAEMMVVDEVVPDGSQCRERNPFALPQQTRLKTLCQPGESHVTQVSDSRLNSKESDSGFLSGMSLHEESQPDINNSCTHSGRISQANTTKQPAASVTNNCDSGLYLELPENLNSLKMTRSAQNNLNNSFKTDSRAASKPFAVNELIKPDEDGDTPLHLAILQGFIEVVFSLVRILSEPCFLEIPNKKQQTPLHLAVLTNQAPLVRRLVVGGANVLLRDRHGNTPLHLACRDGFYECAKALCIPISQEERQATLLYQLAPPQPLPQDLEQRNFDGQMPLHLAAMNGHGQIAKLLCCFGANVNGMEGKYGRTPLHYAVERRHPALLHFLVTQCGALVEAETYAGYTPYQIAASSTPMLAGLLLNLGARPLSIDHKFSSDGEDSDDSSEDYYGDRSDSLQTPF
jgi:ankyrin only family protein